MLFYCPITSTFKAGAAGLMTFSSDAGTPRPEGSARCWVRRRKEIPRLPSRRRTRNARDSICEVNAMSDLGIKVNSGSRRTIIRVIVGTLLMFVFKNSGGRSSSGGPAERHAENIRALPEGQRLCDRCMPAGWSDDLTTIKQFRCSKQPRQPRTARCQTKAAQLQTRSPRFVSTPEQPQAVIDLAGGNVIGIATFETEFAMNKVRRDRSSSPLWYSARRLPKKVATITMRVLASTTESCRRSSTTTTRS